MSQKEVNTVIVKDKHVSATGYKGAPKGLSNFFFERSLREKLKIESGMHRELYRGVHAEQNAIIQCAYHGVSIKDSTIYINTSPYKICTKIIINAVIKRIVYDGDYHDLDEI
jgi:dCMP deaminase